MRKRARIALWSLAGLVIGVISAAAGFYAGLGVGARTMSAMTQTNEAYYALSEVKSSMAALGKENQSLSEHQLAIHLRVALSELGALSKVGAYARCTEKEKDALNDAAGYLALHADSPTFNSDPFILSGTKFCESKQHELGKSKPDR